MPNENLYKLLDKLTGPDPLAEYKAMDAPKVQVDSFISRVANIYEKVRNAIDYKEEHLLRKNAIFRILQRRLLIKISTENVGTTLIKEMIRGGYLENEVIPEEKIVVVNKIIEKYLVLYNLSGARKMTQNGSQLFKWLLSMAACEIEEAIVPPVVNKAMVEFMYRIMRPKIEIKDRSLSDKQKDLLIFLAVYRSLVRSDNAMMDYLLLKYYVPNWTRIDQEKVYQVAKKLSNLKKEIENQKKYYLADKLNRLFKKYIFAFFVLRDLILNNPDEAEEIIANPERLEAEVRQICQQTYKNSRIKLRRSIVRVTIYIFLTKMLLALLLEIPYDKYIAGEVHYLPLIINALFPPVLIFILGVFIKIPSKKNTNQVVNMVKQMTFRNTIQIDGNKLGISLKKRSVFNFIFYFLYSVLFIVSFGFLIYILRGLNFNYFSIGLFLLFLSLVSFFGIKLRMKITEMIVIKRKENPIFFLVNLFTFPFLKVGHWLSTKFSKINIMAFVLDFIIEAPFKIFLEVVEDWLAFLREKKEEIYSKE